MDPTPLELFAGRLHVVLVHFPVALLVTAMVLELARRRRAERSGAALACLTLGAVGALLSLGSGWLLAEHDPPARGLAGVFERHRWLAFSTAGIALVAAALGAAAPDRARVATSYRLALAAAAALVTLTAHAGGTLVHGEGFLFGVFDARGSEVPEPEPVPEPGSSPPHPTTDASPPEPDGPDLEPTSAFAPRLRSLFSAHCIECHGPDRAKAGLRLDDIGALLADELGLWVVAPGEPEESELLRRVTLPPGDEEFMPEEGDPLAPADVALLRAWIEAGAPWEPEGTSALEPRPVLVPEAPRTDVHGRVAEAILFES